MAGHCSEHGRRGRAARVSGAGGVGVDRRGQSGASAGFARRVGITKAATSARLSELVEAGLLTKRPYREPGQRARDEYVLTEAGTEFMPVVWAMFEWGRKHIDDTPLRMTHLGCGAQASVEDTATRLALQAVSAWYNVYGYRTLVRLSEAFADSQRELRGSIETRIRQGAAAAGDIAQVDSYIASSAAQLADFRRQLASAEAQYVAVIGEPAPADLSRAPVPALGGITAATLSGETDRLPLVRAARLGVQAARADVRALQGDRLPQLSAGIDAGRYGIIETSRDYDVRGSVTLSMRIGGGIDQRIGQARARASGADARLRRTQIEVRRDAEIALADVSALNDAQGAIQENYLASRRSRDVLAERFRVSRGTLFDLLAADNNYFGVAARFIQTTIELDTARYALLARTGRLLPALNIQPAALEPR